MAIASSISPMAGSTSDRQVNEGLVQRRCAPHSDRRRSDRRSGSAAPAAEGRRLSDRRRHFARGRNCGARSARFRCRDHGSELHARHHVGPGRAGSAYAHSRHRFGAAGDRDDRLGHGGSGGGSHARRRARFRAEALGERSAADHRQDADRSEQRHAPGTAAGSREPPAARRRRSER